MDGSWIVFPLVGLTMMIVMGGGDDRHAAQQRQPRRPWLGPAGRGDGGATGVTTTGHALDVLARRYASGELGDEEYEHRRAALAGRR